MLQWKHIFARAVRPTSTRTLSAGAIDVSGLKTPPDGSLEPVTRRAVLRPGEESRSQLPSEKHDRLLHSLYSSKASAEMSSRSKGAAHVRLNAIFAR